MHIAHSTVMMNTINECHCEVLLNLHRFRGGDDHHGLCNENNHDDGHHDDDDDETSPSRQHFGSWAPSTVETMRSIFANSPPNSPNPNTLIFLLFN